MPLFKKNTHIIELPTAVGIHQIRNVISTRSFFPEDPDEICLSFHPQKTHIDPMGIALLGAWALFWRERGVPIRCKNLASSGVLYARNMGLFDHIHAHFSKPIEQHEEAGRFVRLTIIRTQEDLSRLCANVAGVLRAPHLVELVQYVLAELVRNALEHSGSMAAVCAQYYAKDKRVTIGIVDCGRGIKESLRGQYGFHEDRPAILAAMRPGVSGVTRSAYSAPNNAGLGLFYARGIAKASARPFVRLSGSAIYKQIAAKGGGMPAQNPQEEKHRIFENVGLWQGTAIGINIRGFDGNLRTFMARMKPLLNIGSPMKRTPALKFT